MDHSQPAETAAAAPAAARAAGDQEPTSRNSSAPEVSRGASIADVQFDALRSAYHHEDREQFYSFVHRLIMFAVTLSGTAAFASYNAASGGSAGYFSLVVAVLGLVDLVYDLSSEARIHGLLRSKFLEIFADTHKPDADASELTVRMVRLYAEEPASHRIVDAVAYNAAVRTLGRPEGRMLVVLPWQQLLRHFVIGAQMDFLTRDEAKSGEKRAYPL